jgi:gliding motility-associated-like protein
LLGLCANAKAQQNLVPNPNFEEKWDCPLGNFNLMDCKDWFSVYPANGDKWTNTVSIPDYYNVCAGPCCSYYNSYGYQVPHSGVAYTQIMAYFEPNPNERIYLEVRLTEPLKKDQWYKIIFYVALINKSMYYTSNGIGAYLSIDKLEKFNYSVVEVTPAIMASKLVKDTLNWTEVSGNYKASGGEEYISFGNFFNDASTNFDTIHSLIGNQCIYYIDDVSVMACDTCEKIIPNDLFIPDAFSPNGDGKNDLLFVRGNNIQELYFAIYDRWGEKVFETTDKNNGWDGNYKGKELNGAVFVYYCKGKYIDGTAFDLKGDITMIR